MVSAGQFFYGMFMLLNGIGIYTGNTFNPVLILIAFLISGVGFIYESIKAMDWGHSDD